MRVLISGASGMIGSALARSLRDGGHAVMRLERGGTSDAGRVAWDPLAGTIDRAGLANLDAVVHLAGENISSGRWSDEKKARIRHSRVDGTRLLVQALTELDTPPATLITASAVGYYGNRGEAVLDEDSPAGEDFLAKVCVDWEAATAPAREAGIRVVNLRIGMVLDPAGGALARMLPLFRAGLGGRVGGGAQYVSWVTLRDLVGAIRHCLEHIDLDGAVNAVAPQPVTQAELARALGCALRRPVLVPVPALAIRLALGEQGEALLLASARIRPARLEASGYAFADREIGPALARLCGTRSGS